MRGTRAAPTLPGVTDAWRLEMDEGDPTAELRFPELETYLSEVELRRDMLTVYERYRSA